MKEEVGSTKEQKYRVISNAILRLMDTQGQAAITHTRVSSASRVSRAWLYKYIGKKKEDLIHFAIVDYGKQFTNLDRPYRGKNPASFRHAVMLGNVEMFENALKMPHLISLYYKHIRSENELGKTIRKIEGLYIQKISKKIAQIYKIDFKKAQYFAELMTAMRMSLALQMIRYADQDRPTSRQMQKLLSEVIAAF